MRDISLGRILFHDGGGVAQEARRAKFKFAGRQKIVVSRNWGFTNPHP
jgi:hypothetical protein